MSTQLLLCTDMDRTVLPNGEHPESRDARRLFTTLVARPEVTLVYVTGRDLQLVETAITHYCLPRPDFIISDVGSMIYRYKMHSSGDYQWHLWQDWQQNIAPDWGGLDHTDISRLLVGVTDLQLQEQSKQNRYKSSYYIPLDVNTASLSQTISKRLDDGNIRANLVWSIDEPRSIGLLDILPASASKKQAVDFLMERNDFALTDTVFAGDSGNDLPVLTSEIPAVLVANASNDVRRDALSQATASGHAHALYLAKGDFMDMNGNYAAGVVEGVVHYKPDVCRWLTDNTDASNQ